MTVENGRRMRVLAVFVLVLVAGALVAAPWAVEAVVAPEPDVALGRAREAPADANAMAFVVLPAALAMAGVALAVAALCIGRRAAPDRA